MRPVLEAVEKIFVPLAAKLDWGYSIPYMITGQVNQHPRAAIKLRSGEKKDNYVEFYDQIMEEE